METNRQSKQDMAYTTLLHHRHNMTEGDTSVKDHCQVPDDLKVKPEHSFWSGSWKQTPLQAAYSISHW